MIEIKARDIEAIEEQLHDMVEKLEELEAKRSHLRADIVQNRIEAIANKEVEDQVRLYVRVCDLDGFEAHLDDATNHIQHALDIFTDVLPGYARELSTESNKTGGQR